MEFSRKTIVSIFDANFQDKFFYDKDLNLDVLELTAKEAYRFMLTTNSHYLIDEYGLSLFGRFRTFNHRNYNLTSGLFNYYNKRFSDENLPLKLREKYPFIFQGNKKIIFIEVSKSNNVIKETYEKLVSLNKNPRNYIINLVYKNGSNWEHYFEYFAIRYFLNKGFFTDIQLPWSYHGCPDFGLYKHNLQGYSSNPFFIIELSSIKAFNEESKLNINSRLNEDYEFVVGEVKTKQLRSQINEYLETGIPNSGVEFIQNKKNRNKNSGLISINKEFKIVLSDFINNKFFDKNISKKDEKWLKDYIKINLLGNLTFEEILFLYKLKFKNEAELTLGNITKLVKVLTIEDIIKIIKDGI